MANMGQTNLNENPPNEGGPHDDSDDPVYCYLEYFVESNEMENLIKNLKNTSKNERSVEQSYERFRYVMDMYQEQPHLLDKHLQPFIDILLGLVKDESSDPSTIREAFIYLYLLTKTRGYKVILRYLPHEVSDLEPVLALLKQQGSSETSCWEMRYILVLWLSIICMVPFDMSRFDGTVDGKTGSTEPVMDRILNVGKRYLEVVDKTRDAAAYLLSRFLTRPDVIKQRLADIMDWAANVLVNNTETELSCMKERNLLLGVLDMLALLFKQGKREDLLSYAPTLLKTLTACRFQDKKNSLLRQGSMKLIQRVGLIFLKQRVASWRYQRGNRSLTDNLQGNTNTQGKTMVNTELMDEDGDEYEVPGEIEDVIEQLLTGLRDSDTIVRWSAAKGVGRVTGRLPKELADDVVESVLELFSKSETDGAWHGGCLSLAELGRRGLLLPERLIQVVPPVLRALLYDERRGTYSVGAHVRDAACYVCWAFARAYEPEQIKPHVNEIANALVIVSLFDREVNVRRAASAAFQENVGRQGSFPHGIDILTKADYFAVGLRTHCYLQLSPFVADFSEYTRSVISHIADVKTQHWDSCIRELSGESLSMLTAKAPDYIANTVLPSLVPLCVDADATVRHGAILSVANITHALSLICADTNTSLVEKIGETILSEIIGIPGKLDAAKRFRGHGGDLMRQSVCCLIEKMSQSHLQIQSPPVLDLWQTLIDECVCQKEVDTQKSAVVAISAFTLEFYTHDDGTVKVSMQDKLLDKYLRNIHDSSDEYKRVGYCLALGCLPKFVIRGKLRPILLGLIQVTRVADAQWVDSRKSALIALNRIIQTVGVDDSGSDDAVLCGDNLGSVYDTMFLSMGDYTTDSRGDIGRLVREAAICGLCDVTSLVVKTASHLLTPKIVEVMFCLLLQETCEKIDRTRKLACDALTTLLYHDPEIPHIPERENLQSQITETMMVTTNWASASESFSVLVPILQYPIYSYHLLLGLTVSVGGITESVVQHSRESLHNYINAHHSNEGLMTAFMDNLLKIMDKYKKNDRVVMPMFKMMDSLLGQHIFTTIFSDSGCLYPLALLSRCKQEMLRCSNPQKLMCVTDVYCGLLTFETIRRQTLQQLMIMLGHSYPRVRKTTAEKLYEALITYDDVIDEEHCEEVLSLISDTTWDEDIGILRPIRNHLCLLLRIQTPVKLGVNKNISSSDIA